MLAGKQTNDRCLWLHGPCVRQKAEISINTIVVKVWNQCLVTKLPASWSKKKNQMTTAVHKEGYNSFFITLWWENHGLLRIVWEIGLTLLCIVSTLLGVFHRLHAGLWFHLFVWALCSLRGEGFGCFSLLWVKPNSRGVHTFQALTLLELRPAACRQDVDEGRDVDSLGVLTCLKQSLKGHNSNTPVNTVLFSLFNWRISDVLYFSYCQQLIPQEFCV